MRKSLKWNALVGMIAIVALVASACGSDDPTATPRPAATAVPQPTATATPVPTPTPDPDQPKYGGTLKVAYPGTTVGLDPAIMDAGGQYDMLLNSSQNMLYRDFDLVVQPDAAESWEVNEDLTVYTFKLRRTKFHHGKEFTADDVVHTFNRLLDPDVASPARSGFKVIKSVIKVDDHTVRFELESGSAFFPDNLDLYQAKIIASDIDTTRLANEIFGTGPFKLVEYAPGERAVFEKNPDYWDEDLPYLDGFIFFFIPEAETRVQAVKTGTVDAMNPLAASSVSVFEADSNLAVSEAVSGSYLTLATDNRTPPWSDKKVRKALQIAIDRDGIVKAALFGRGSPGLEAPFPSTNPYFDKSLKVPAYDPQQAKQLLAEAGYPDGLEVDLYTSPSVPGMVELAVAVKEQAAAAGFRVNVQRTPSDTYWGKTWMQEQFFVSYWGDRPPDLALNVAFRSDAPWNESHYDSPEIDRLMTLAAATKGFEARKQVYADLQRILLDDATRIVPAFVSNLLGFRNSVRGLRAHPTGRIFLHQTWLDK